MRMLAIDTSTHACTAALMVDNELYTQFALTPRGHTELILDMCDKVLAEGGITQQQLDVIACGRGPGSFTGVRIAAGLAQGMALALEIPIVAVSSLAAAAQHAYSEYGQDHLYVAMDARMQETYCCYYVATDDGYVIAEIDETLCAPDEAPVPKTEGYMGVGSAWSEYRGLLQARLAPHISKIEADCYPHAAAIATLGKRELNEGRTVPPEKFSPVYLRDKVAEKAQA